MSAAAYRRILIERLIAGLLPLEAVRACFEGGSAATGRLDDFSDVDLMIVAPLAASEAVFNAVETALSSFTAITHRWPVEPPPFPDTAQLDPVAETEANVETIELLWDTLDRIDEPALAAALERHDAIAAHRLVQRAILGRDG